VCDIEKYLSPSNTQYQHLEYLSGCNLGTEEACVMG